MFTKKDQISFFTRELLEELLNTPFKDFKFFLQRKDCTFARLMLFLKNNSGFELEERLQTYIKQYNQYQQKMEKEDRYTDTVDFFYSVFLNIPSLKERETALTTLEFYTFLRGFHFSFDEFRKKVKSHISATFMTGFPIILKNPSSNTVDAAYLKNLNSSLYGRSLMESEVDGIVNYLLEREIPVTVESVMDAFPTLLNGTLFSTDQDLRKGKTYEGVEPYGDIDQMPPFLKELLNPKHIFNDWKGVKTPPTKEVESYLKTQSHHSASQLIYQCYLDKDSEKALIYSCLSMWLRREEKEKFQLPSHLEELNSREKILLDLFKIIEKRIAARLTEQEISSHHQTAWYTLYDCAMSPYTKKEYAILNHIDGAFLKHLFSKLAEQPQFRTDSLFHLQEKKERTWILAQQSARINATETRRIGQEHFSLFASDQLSDFQQQQLLFYSGIGTKEELTREGLNSIYQDIFTESEIDQMTIWLKCHQIPLTEGNFIKISKQYLEGTLYDDLDFTGYVKQIRKSK